MKMKLEFLLLGLISIFSFSNISGQKIVTGKIINRETNEPVEYVNIGIQGKETGTVSDNQGNFQLLIADKNLNDTLTVSCIGFNIAKVGISKLINADHKNILLTEKAIDLKEILVKPKKYKTRILGITAKNKKILGGFTENKLGYELGVAMSAKKSAYIRKINLNIASCEYDTVFYRLNVYEGTLKHGFENIMREPFYFKIPKSQIKDKISIDVQKLKLVVRGNFLVTLEYVKDLGKGGLYFPISVFNKSYARKTSQGEWKTTPVGISLNIEADVEQ